MNEKPSTLSVALFRNKMQSRESSGEKRVFTGMIAHCQLMLDGNAAVFEFVLTPKASPIYVGRKTEQAEPEINIDLTSFNGHVMGVSRAHARFERSGTRLFVRDMDSTNGTWVNGERVKADFVHEVFHGDTIEFGRLATTLYIKT